MFVCTGCGLNKNADEYSMILNRRKERVRSKRCKECVREYKRRHYAENRDKYLEKSRKQYWSDVEYWSEYNKRYREENREKIAAQVREHMSCEKVRERTNARYRRYRKDPEFRRREKARGMLNKRIQSGKIIKPDECSQCGKTGNIEGHHPDYDKPPEVIWVCKKCHEDIHQSNEGHKTE